MFEISYFIHVTFFIIIIYLFIVILRLFSIEHPLLDSKCSVCIELNLPQWSFIFKSSCRRLTAPNLEFEGSFTLPWIMNFGIKWKSLKNVRPNVDCLKIVIVYFHPKWFSSKNLFKLYLLSSCIWWKGGYWVVRGLIKKSIVIGYTRIET